MKKIGLLFTIHAVILLCCVKPLSFYRYSPADTLERAYKKNDLKRLHKFFEQWRGELRPFSEIESTALSDTTQKLVDLFAAFYQPFQLSNYNSDLDDTFYKGIQYAVVQNTLTYSFIDSIDMKSEIIPPKRYFYWTYPSRPLKRKISPFRPDLNLEGIEILYLSKFYLDIILEFLGENNFIPPMPGESDTNYEKEKEYRKKRQFLNNYIKITTAHMGGGSNLLTFPVASRIYFTKDLKQAVISYQVGLGSGRAYFKLKEDTWQLIGANIFMYE